MLGWQFSERVFIWDSLLGHLQSADASDASSLVANLAAPAQVWAGGMALPHVKG